MWSRSANRRGRAVGGGTKMIDREQGEAFESERKSGDAVGECAVAVEVAAGGEVSLEGRGRSHISRRSGRSDSPWWRAAGGPRPKDIGRGRPTGEARQDVAAARCGCAGESCGDGWRMRWGRSCHASSVTRVRARGGIPSFHRPWFRDLKAPAPSGKTRIPPIAYKATTR